MYRVRGVKGSGPLSAPKSGECLEHCLGCEVYEQSHSFWKNRLAFYQRGHNPWLNFPFLPLKSIEGHLQQPEPAFVLTPSARFQGGHTSSATGYLVLLAFGPTAFW